MKFKRCAALSASLCLAASAVSPTLAQTPSPSIKHVLLISVDGMHAVDLKNYVGAHTTSAFYALTHSGVTYPHAITSKPSDSFPGLMSQVTGGGPQTTGVWYDDSYDRALAPPGSTAPFMLGTEVQYNEVIDKDQTLTHLNGGGNFDASSIDPNLLPVDPLTGNPVYPHTYLRVNTIFEVAKAAGMHTAWSDKHPAYEIVNGPSGTGLDDFYAPEINAAIAIDPTVTNPNLLGSSHLVDADFNPNNLPLSTTTTSVKLTEAYDDLKVQSILNQIDGKNSRGTSTVGVPAIFGMNFQAVSVGQKLTADFLLANQPGGYTNGLGTPTVVLQDALDHVDQSLGKMIAELKTQTEADGTPLINTTLIIVSAKHGQSPIDPTKFIKTGGHTITKLMANAGIGLAQNTDDDVALLWLANQTQLLPAVQYLTTHRAAGYIQALLWGASMKHLYDDPTKDSRTPDIIVTPYHGVIYTKSTAKHAEHGGFTDDDTNVLLVVSNPSLTTSTVTTRVKTTQIAPTILKALGLDPGALQAVKSEGTPILPGLGL